MTAQDPATTPAPATTTDATARPPRHMRLGRRSLAWVALTAVLTGGLLTTLRPPDTLSTLAAVAVAALGAGTLARYVPTVGARLDLGCTPCAVASGLSVPIAIGVLAAGMAPLAVAVAAFGLVQRLRQPDACPT